MAQTSHHSTAAVLDFIPFVRTLPSHWNHWQRGPQRYTMSFCSIIYTLYRKQFCSYKIIIVHFDIINC